MKMKLEDKWGIPLSENYIGTTWSVDEAKTYDECISLIQSVLKLWKVQKIDCRGYSDMDTHGNECFFRSKEEFDGGLDMIKKIDVDNIGVDFVVGEEEVSVGFHGIGINGMASVSVCGDKAVVKKVVGELKKLTV